MRNRSGENGFTLLTTTLCLFGLIATIGLAIDVGRLYIAKSEVQNFTDSASLAATLELDGTWSGIYRALGQVSSNANRWNFVTSSITQTTTTFAQSKGCPWTTMPTDPAGYKYARVIASVDVPLTFMSIFMGEKTAIGNAAFLVVQSVQKVSGDSAGGQELKTTWAEGLFPFSPYVHDTTGPYFGLVPGQQYTLRWPSNPRLNSNTCSGDNQQVMLTLAEAGGGSERGFIESTSASLI